MKHNPKDMIRDVLENFPQLDPDSKCFDEHVSGAELVEYMNEWAADARAYLNEEEGGEKVVDYLVRWDMVDYLVRWDINVFAGSKREAAKIARDIQMDPSNEAKFYEVRCNGYDDDDWMSIELS